MRRRIAAALVLAAVLSLLPVGGSAARRTGSGVKDVLLNTTCPGPCISPCPVHGPGVPGSFTGDGERDAVRRERMRLPLLPCRASCKTRAGCLARQAAARKRLALKRRAVLQLVHVAPGVTPPTTFEP